MLSTDRWIALALAVSAVAIFFTARNFPSMPGLGVGPGLFPMVLSLALLAACGFLALQEKPTAPAASVEEAPPRHRLGLWRMLAVLAACALFAGLGKALGFVIVGFLSVAGLMLAFGVRFQQAVLISGSAVVLLNLFFVKVMRIPLPLGWLAPFGGWL